MRSKESTREVPGAIIDAKWVKERLAERNKSIASLARSVGRDRAAMSRIVNGEQALQLWMVPIIAKEIGVTPTELLNRTSEVKLPPDRHVPIMEWYCAGAYSKSAEPLPLTSNASLLVSDDLGAALVAFVVEDDDLQRTIPRGSTIVVDHSNKKLDDWEIGVFAFSGGAHLRRLRFKDGRRWLVSERIDPQRDEWIEIANAEPVGKVVGIPELGSVRASAS